MLFRSPHPSPTPSSPEDNEAEENGSRNEEEEETTGVMWVCDGGGLWVCAVEMLEISRNRVRGISREALCHRGPATCENENVSRM